MIQAISLTQPWATLVAAGAKAYETRSWRTTYRGRIAIHAAKGLAGTTEGEFQALCNAEPFASALHRAGVDLDRPRQSLPFGAILAVVKLAEIVPTSQVRERITPTERAFGNYADGRFAWRFSTVQPLDHPIPCAGALGVWRVPDAIEDDLVAALTSHVRAALAQRSLS